MNRPIVIVEPVSSGSELAPTFKRHGIPAIAVTLNHQTWPGYGATINSDDYIAILENSDEIIEQLRAHQPLAVIAGADEGIPLADQLSQALTPECANDCKHSAVRQHKALMQHALAHANVPTLATLSTSSISEAQQWLDDNQLSNSALCLKPPASSGSDKVFLIAPGQDWKTAFETILNEPATVTQQRSDSVVIQQQAVGTEYAVGTVSANGKHSITHIIQYNKCHYNGRDTVYDYVEFVEYNDTLHRELVDYTRDALDALGIRWGATHTEIMLTEQGPRLIETSPRMIGGPTVFFSRIATGSSQADRLVEAVATGSVSQSMYNFKQTVMPVFLRSPANGVITNIDLLEQANQLKSHLKTFCWYNNGDTVPQTIDYLSNLGIIALHGNFADIKEDYAHVRTIERQLNISG